MKYIKLIIIAVFLSSFFTGCSYVSDMVEGAISKRSSFAVTASYSSGNVILTWDKTDTDEDFTGIEIYRTSEVNDEYASYELVASRINNDVSGTLDNGLTTTYAVSQNLPSTPAAGVYFYRIGFIHWGDPVDKRTTANGYTGIDTTDYNEKTGINAISGYGRVVIP